MTKRILATLAFLAALFLSYATPKVEAAPPGNPDAGTPPASQPQPGIRQPVPPAPTPAANPAPEVKPVKDTKPGGPAVDKRIPTGGVKKGGRRTGVLSGHAVVFDMNMPCVQGYIAQVKALGMSPVPDMYVAELPLGTKQYLAYDSATGQLTGTSETECKKETEPVLHSPGVDAFKGSEKTPVCAMVRQWYLYALRSSSRLAKDAPTVEFEGVIYKRWGVVVGDVTQPNVGYSYCSEPLKSSASKGDLKAALEKAMRDFWAAIAALWVKIGEIDNKNTEQDGRLNRIEAEIDMIKRRRPVDPILGLTVVGSPSGVAINPISGGLQFCLSYYAGDFRCKAGIRLGGSVGPAIHSIIPTPGLGWEAHASFMYEIGYRFGIGGGITGYGDHGWTNLSFQSAAALKATIGEGFTRHVGLGAFAQVELRVVGPAYLFARLGGAAGWDRTAGYTPKGEFTGATGFLVRLGAGAAPSR